LSHAAPRMSFQSPKRAACSPARRYSLQT
jgi:hypothetical protein